eukprot:2235553-Rhodomonas_salina.2
MDRFVLVSSDKVLYSKQLVKRLLVRLYSSSPGLTSFRKMSALLATSPLLSSHLVCQCGSAHSASISRQTYQQEP